MKTSDIKVLQWAASVVLCLGLSTAMGADNAVDTSQAANDASAVASAGNKLAYGVQDVINLCRAQVSEPVVITYVQTAGTVYTLRPSDIMHLHNQGVSDRIITVMLEQGRKQEQTTSPATEEMPAQPQPAAVAAAPVAPVTPVATENPLFIPGQNAFEIAASYNPLASCETVSPSTLYVIPYSSTPGYRPVYTFYPGCSYSSYSYYRPYYSTGYRSYGYCSPSSVIRIGGGSSGHHYSFHRR